MVQAIEMLYFTADVYSASRKRGGGPSARLVFQEYAEDQRFECSDIASAERLYRKHIQFLTMCFLNRAQDISWSNTPIYQYLKRQFPVSICWFCTADFLTREKKIFEATKARKAGRYDDASKAIIDKPDDTPSLQQSRTTRSTSVTQKPSGKPKTEKPKTEKPKKDDNWWEAAAIYEFIRSAVNKRVLRPGRYHITLDRVANLMTKRYEIDEVDTARHVLLVHAQNLCYKIDHPRTKAALFLADEPIYRELEAGHDLAAAEIRRAQGVELRPRRDYAPLETESESSSESADEVVVVTPQRPLDKRRKRGRLSVLRPKSGKYSGKGKTIKSRKGPDAGERSDEEMDLGSEPDDEGETESGYSDSVTEVDTPTQAISPNREKRKFVDTGNDEEEKGRRKRAASSTSMSPGSSPASSDSDTNDEAPIPLRNAVNPSANDKATNAPPKSNLVAPIVSTPLPTYVPNGPRDSWNCTFDGCNQKIYGASKPIGRQLITEHLEDHSKGRQQVVGIVWRENQKLALPVK